MSPEPQSQLHLHLHRLTGCTPTPLAGYLKALGVLRIITEQADPNARGWWQDEQFCLLSCLDETALRKFFVHEYAPTPFVSPWNKGSGFYAETDKGLSPLEGSVAPRFAAFREGIAAARGPLEQLQQADGRIRELKDGTKAKKGMTAAEKAAAVALKSDPDFKRELAEAERTFKRLKADLFSPCRRDWRGPHRAWMDAAVVIRNDGTPTFPALLGTGGNDGRLDFTNNAMQRIADLFELDSEHGTPQPDTEALLDHALWSTPCPALSPKASIGQFFPGGAGGANSTSGPDGDSLINPWDFVLMLEGSIVVQSRLTRQLNANGGALASAPFAMYAHATGHATPGDEKVDRGEQWLPLWGQPCTLAELQTLFGEALLQLGRKQVTRPVDAARAIAGLGSARGITAFTRFGYLERNGQSNLAVPLARIEVRSRPTAHLIDDLAGWMDRLQREARSKHAAQHLVMAERRLAASVLAALTHDTSADRWQAILTAATAVETLQAHGTAIAAGPMPALRTQWVGVCDDGTPEWRLALSLGSAAAKHEGKRRLRQPVREHWLPLEPGHRRFRTSDKRLLHDAREVITGRDFCSDAVAIVERRLVDARKEGRARLPLRSAPGLGARPADLAAFLAGELNDTRISELARALMAVKWHNWNADAAPGSGPAPQQPDDGWWILRLAHLPWALRHNIDIPVDPAIVRRCHGGDAVGAGTLALRRLRAHGLRPTLDAVLVSRTLARRWAAALVFPIAHATALTAARTLQPSL